MFNDDHDGANTTGDKDREKKHTLQTINLSDQNLNRDQIVQFRTPPEPHEPAIGMYQQNIH